MNLVLVPGTVGTASEWLTADLGVVSYHNSVPCLIMLRY